MPKVSAETKNFMIIGNIGFELMASYLKSHQIKTTLVMTTKDPINGHLADRAFFYRDNDDFFPLIDFVLRNKVDAVISISGPDRANVRDSYLREYLEPTGVKVIANPLKSVKIAADKVKTKIFLKEHGFPFVNGDEAYSEEQVRVIAKKIGFPLVFKAYRDSGGMGFEIIRNKAGLDDLLALKPDFPVLMEEYTPGYEFSVEVLNYEGKSLALNPVFKGHTMSCGVHPMERVKLSPPPVDERDSDIMRKIAEEVVSTLNLEPTGDIDFVWVPGTGPKIFEINPRFGGVTALSMASSQIDVYKAVVDMALGRWQTKHLKAARSFSMDIPITDDLTESQIVDLFSQNHSIFRIKKQKLRKTAGRITISCDSREHLMQNASFLAKRFNTIYDIEEIINTTKPLNLA